MFKKGSRKDQMGKVTDQTGKGEVYRVRDLSHRRAKPFNLVPGPAALPAIADELGLSDLRKLRFTGRLVAEGRADWRLTAHLGATVTQACVVSLAPVTTRLEEDVTRRFLHDWPPARERDGDEVEMPEDDSIEPLGDAIDLRVIMIEALTLALPDYPRAPDASLDMTRASPPGAAPIRDTKINPFAALAGLKGKLGEDGG